MIVDTSTFREIAVALKLSSDEVLTLARCLATLSARYSDIDGDPTWLQTVDSLMKINMQVSQIENLLRALMAANKEEQANAKKNDPLPS